MRSRRHNSSVTEVALRRRYKKHRLLCTPFARFALAPVFHHPSVMVTSTVHQLSSLVDLPVVLGASFLPKGSSSSDCLLPLAGVWDNETTTNRQRKKELRNFSKCKHEGLLKSS